MDSLAKKTLESRVPNGLSLSLTSTLHSEQLVATKRYGINQRPVFALSPGGEGHGRGVDDDGTDLLRTSAVNLPPLVAIDHEPVLNLRRAHHRFTYLSKAISTEIKFISATLVFLEREINRIVESFFSFMILFFMLSRSRL